MDIREGRGAQKGQAIGSVAVPFVSPALEQHEETEVWEGLTVPKRDSIKVRNRRLFQCQLALNEIKHHCKDRMGVCVQAGGNWGYWPLRLADMFESVYTFEPDHVCFSCLVNNVRHKPNVVCFQAAVGVSHAFVDLWRDTDTTGNQYVSGEGIYPTLDIDSLRLNACDLIYLDVEGHEMKGLLSATATILKHKPIVAFESCDKYDKDKHVQKYMERYGYQFLGTVYRDTFMGPK